VKFSPGSGDCDAAPERAFSGNGETEFEDQIAAPVFKIENIKQAPVANELAAESANGSRANRRKKFKTFPKKANPSYRGERVAPPVGRVSQDKPG
jgi:hypothetical protein